MFFTYLPELYRHNLLNTRHDQVWTKLLLNKSNFSCLFSRENRYLARRWKKMVGTDMSCVPIDGKNLLLQSKGGKILVTFQTKKPLLSHDEGNNRSLKRYPNNRHISITSDNFTFYCRRILIKKLERRKQSIDKDMWEI